MEVCRLWVSCVVRERSLRRFNHSSREVLPTVVHRCVWSRNLANEKALAHWGDVAPKINNGFNKKLQLLNKHLCVLHSCFSNVPFRISYWTRPSWQGSIYWLVTLSRTAHVLEPLHFNVSLTNHFNPEDEGKILLRNDCCIFRGIKTQKQNTEIRLILAFRNLKTCVCSNCKTGPTSE